MSDLRVSLIVVGAIIVVAIILFDRWRRRRALHRSWNDLPDPADRAGHDDIADDLDDWEVIPITNRREVVDDADLGNSFAASHDAVEFDEESSISASRDAPDALTGSPLDSPDDDGTVSVQKSATSPQAAKVDESVPSPKGGVSEKRQGGSEPAPRDVVKGDTGEGRGGVTAQVTEPPPRQPDLLLVLSVLAPPGHEFSGTRIFEAAGACGLLYGEKGIFHAYPAGGGDMPLFSMANILEPGSFDRGKMALLRTPGLVLFMQLPGPLAGKEAFSTMHTAARQIARKLGGTLADGRRHSLSAEAERGLAEQAAPYRPIARS